MRKLKVIKTLCILLAGLLSSCLPDGEFKTRINFEPVNINDGWEISDPVQEGLDPESLQNIYEMMFAEDRFITSRSLIIVKNGKLISESYFRSNEDIYRKNNIQGITKSVTSLLAGLAWDQGHFNPEDSLYGFIPGYFDGDANKRGITIEHLLTMTSGLKWDNDRNTVDLFNSSRYPSSMRIVLTKPLLSAAGGDFFYNHGTPQLVTGMLGEVFGQTSTESIIHDLFYPLGIEDYVWESHADGLSIGGLGLHLKPRDIARIGQFCLQKGVWNDNRVISEEWLDASTTAKIGPDETGTVMHYGYYWWIHAENNAYIAIGEGGQYLYIVPEKEVVIVHTASPFSGTGYGGVNLEDFLSIVDIIIGSVK